MPTITQLSYILAVQRTRHFGQAAKECHVSQPSLSAQIQKVEEELGIVIFDRSKKPIMVTEKGQRVIAQAQSILNEHRKIFEIANDQEVIAGDFHLGVIPTLAAYVLPLFIESFAIKYPDVHLKISEYKTDEIIHHLSHDEIDAGLLVTPLPDDQLLETVLFYEPFHVFASKQHPLTVKANVRESDLEAESVWLLEEGHCFRNQVMRVCHQPTKRPMLKNVSFASGNLETLMNLIRRGRGYTLLPYLATLNLTAKEKSDNLRSFANPVPTREVSLVYRRAVLKHDIRTVLEREILAGLPQEIRNFRRENSEVIAI